MRSVQEIKARFGSCAHCAGDKLLRAVETPKGPRWVCSTCRRTFWLDLATEAEPGTYGSRETKPPLSLDAVTDKKHGKSQ